MGVSLSAGFVPTIPTPFPYPPPSREPSLEHRTEVPVGVASGEGWVMIQNEEQGLRYGGSN